MNSNELKNENHMLRELLFIRHGCDFINLYGDDGEMQCHKCGIDFKRMSPSDIKKKFESIGLKEYMKKIRDENNS